MNLRTATIGTTTVMLIGTVVAPYILLQVGVFQPHGFAEDIGFATGLWMFSGSPLLVSLVLALKLKYDPSTVVLLVSTIAYGAWYIMVCYASFDGYLGILVLYAVGILSLPVMIPAWVSAGFMEWKAKSNTRPGTAAPG